MVQNRVCIVVSLALVELRRGINAGILIPTVGGGGRRVVFVIAILCVALVLGVGGCTSGDDGPSWRSLCRNAGLCDTPPPSSELVDVLCDDSVGSTCTPEHLSATLTAVLGRVGTRPGSRVRLWMLGASVDATELIAEITVPAPTGKTPKARVTEAAHWQAHALEVFLASTNPAITQTRAPKSSPIAEAIAKIALADSRGLGRELVLVTDGRETSLSDFECGTLPTDDHWRARLKARRLLAPGTLAGTSVTFSYLTLPPIRRCRLQVQREIRTRELWTQALTAAGARSVRMLSGPLSWDERPAHAAGEEVLQ